MGVVSTHHASPICMVAIVGGNRASHASFDCLPAEKSMPPQRASLGAPSGAQLRRYD
jgi:hypothetical protein